MEIPTPYLFKIETPTLLFNKHLFQLSNEMMPNATASNINDINTIGADNFIDIYGKKFNLVEIATPKVLEDLYFDNNKELFEQYKQNFVSTSMNQLYFSADQIASELKNNKTLNLIVNEILPVITAVKVDNQLDAALADKVYNPREDMKDIFSTLNRSSGRVNASNNSALVDKTKDDLIKKIEEEYKNVGIKQPISSRQSSLEDNIYRELIGGGSNRERSLPVAPSILTNELLSEQNFLFIENRAYELCNVPKLVLDFKNKISDRFFKELSLITPDTDPLRVVDIVKQNYNQVEPSAVSRLINKLRSTKFKINGDFFFPLYFNESAGIVSDYKKLVEKKLKIDSINHTRFQAESLRKIEEEKAQLSKLVNTDKFELNGAGFEKINGGYYVFITTPEFVLKSPHNNLYYKFGKAKIGLEISMNGNYVTIEEPTVLNSYKHPFLRGECTYQKICMGQYNTSVAKRLPPGQAVLTILTKAQENLMMGYRTGSNPHNTLTDAKFQSYKISKPDFERSGLVCLNDYKDRVA